MDTEQQLLQAIRQGDSKAQRDLYCHFAPLAMAVAMRYVASQDAARDVLQESFVRILTSLPRFEYRGKGSLRAWILRIVSNEAVSYLRQQSRLLLVDDLPQGAADEQPDEQPDVSDIPPEVIHQLLQQLPTGYRTVFNLFALEQRSHREIAQMLGIKESTSASQYFRARKLLAAMLKEYQNSIET